MHDAVKLESAGLPAAVVIEEGFKELAFAKRRLMGLEALTPIIIPGHMGTREGARQQAEAAVAGIVQWVRHGNRAAEPLPLAAPAREGRAATRSSAGAA